MGKSMLIRGVSGAPHPEKVVPKSTPTMSRSATGAGSFNGSRTGPLMASVDDGGV